MSLKGGAQIKARLAAVRLAFKPIGRKWADTTVDVMRPMVPTDTNRLRNSIKRKNATQRKATVAAHYSAYFVDKGPKAHKIAPKKAGRLAWQAEGRTIFARRVNHPGYRGRPFRARAAHEALRRHPMAETLIAEWNAAA